MKKRFWACFLSLSLLLTMMPTMAFAEEEESANGISGGIAWKVENNELTISAADVPENGYDPGEMPDYVRAANLENSVPWYSYLGEISTVTLNEGVKNIGDSAFYKAKQLTSITYQGNVDEPLELGIAAIGGCLSLTNITGLDCHRDAESGLIFDGLNSKKKVIGFSGEVNSVEIPDSVTTIGLSAFNGCTTLQSIDLGEVQVIEDNAFNSCTNLTTITFPNTLRTIGDWAFGGGTGLTVLELPEGVVSIGTGAFGSSNLKEVILPNSIVNIGNECFAYSNDLEKVILSGNLQTVGRSMFHSCKALKSIKIPEGITTIEQSAFYNCSDLKYVWLPTSLDSIENSAFYGCKGLNHINIPLGVKTFGSTVFDESGTYQSPLVIYVDNNEYMANLPTIANEAQKVSKAVTNGGTFAEDTEFTSGSLARPAKIDYIFDGWYTKDGTGDDWDDKATTPTVGTTYYAKWTACDHSEGKEYTATGAIITEKCSACGHVFGTATISAPTGALIYDGTAKTAAVTTSEGWEGGTLAPTYNGETSAPVNAGTYTASITVGDATATVEFTIEKAEPELSIIPSNTELSGGGNVILNIAGAPDENKVTVTCDNENIEVTENADDTYTVTLPNETAKYTFTAAYEGDHNHDAADDTCTVSVTRHTGGGGASHPEASDDSSSDRNDRDDDDTENIDEEDVPLTEGKVADFDDVPADAWFAEAVQYVYEHDLMTGVSENLFAPNAQMNRAMVAQILFNVEKPADTEAPAAFRDVAADQWYAKAVNWAVWQGYMSGYGAGSFGPNDALTREQLVTVLWRYSGSPVMGDSSMLNTFSDAAMTSDYAQQAMTWAYAQGVISGNADGTLNPQGTATRAEVATILMRFYENMAE